MNSLYKGRELMLIAWRLIDPKLLARIDLISAGLGIVYVLLNRLLGLPWSGLPGVCVIALSLLTFAAKRRAKAVYAAAAYALLTGIAAYWVHMSWDVPYHGLDVWLPVMAFLAALLFDWQTGWLTGMLVGWWGIVMFVSYTQGDLVGATEFGDLLVHMPLLLIAGLLTSLFSRRQPYVYTGDRMDKLDFILILLGIGYMWSAWSVPGTPTLLPVLYMGMTVTSAYARRGHPSKVGASAYGLLALVIGLQLLPILGGGGLYLVILLPMAAFGLTLAFAVRTEVLTALGAGYWIAIGVASLREPWDGALEHAAHLFSNEAATRAMGSLLWMLPAAALWLVTPRRFRLLQRSKASPR